MSSITAAHLGSNKGIKKHKGGFFGRLREKVDKAMELKKAKAAEQASANLPMHGDERHNPPAAAVASAAPEEGSELEKVTESPAVDPGKSAAAFKMKRGAAPKFKDLGSS